jgi:hypothetical protein
MDVQHRKLLEIHIRFRKVFDLLNMYAVLSGLFDTAAEGVLSRIITCVKELPFVLVCFSLLKYIWSVYISSKSDTYSYERPE